MPIPDLTRARWRVSTRSEGANTCVQAAAVDDMVAVQNSNDPSPAGPVLAVPARGWEEFIAHALAGQADRAALTEPRDLGPFHLATTDDGGVELRTPDAGPVTFTPAEWDVFTASLPTGEFTLPWLTSSPT